MPAADSASATRTPAPFEARAQHSALRAGIDASPARIAACTCCSSPAAPLSPQAGALITRVLYAKENGGKQFLIVDAAMNDLIRPSLYRRTP